MKAGKKDVYRAKIGSFEIRGGITPTGKASVILGMPSAQEKSVFIALKIDDKEKLLAIVDCIFTTMAEAKLEKEKNKDGHNGNDSTSLYSSC